MAKSNLGFLAFNRGLVSASALARIDVERIRLSASVMTNWLPHTAGSMSLRPGFGYIANSASNNRARYLEFVAATSDTALIEVTNSVVRIVINDVLLTRPSVATSISNGSFATSVNWTDGSAGGGALTFGGSGLILNATNRGGLAKCTRQITVAGGDQGVEHGLRITVGRGPVTFRCGSSAGGDQYVTETVLRTGVHSLAITPTGDFHFTFQSDLQRNVIVTSISVEAAGVISIPAPWTTSDLDYLRRDQSADVVFIACDGYKQRRIERRGTGRSWSVVEYSPEDGPFSAGRTAKAKLKVAATYGNTALTSDKAFFKSTQVGAMFRLFNTGYNGSFKLGAEDTYTDPIRVTGVRNDSASYNDRAWSYAITGTWVGTINIQRSFDGPDSGFQDYGPGITSNASGSASDEDNNTIVYYRFGFKPGNYTSGTATVSLVYAGGGGFGICRVTALTSSTVVDVEVLKEFNDTVHTADWRESIWSDLRGWPTAVGLYEGRLWWPGRIYNIGSISDAYESFDQDAEGDKGPIVRTIGSGPVDVINWLLPLQRQILGTAGSEISVRSSSFDEPLTPQNANAKNASTQGSAKIAAAVVDTRGVFVQRSRKRLFELVYDPQGFDYSSAELTTLVPDLTGSAKFVWLAVQRQPDTRIHCGLDDGTVMVLTYEPSGDLKCWSKIAMPTGSVQILGAAVLPGDDEDKVYYHVVDGSQRHLLKWALESECVGGTLNKQLDTFITYTGGATTTPTVTPFVAGNVLTVWANGVCLADVNGDVATFTASGSPAIITLPSSLTNLVIGRAYQATYKSTKLAYASEMGTPLTQRKKIDYIGLILQNTHHRGLLVGRDFTNINNLPQVKDELAVTADTIHADWDQPAGMFDGSWNTDSRLCLVANAPRPCTICAAVLTVDQHDKGSDLPQKQKTA